MLRNEVHKPKNWCLKNYLLRVTNLEPGLISKRIRYDLPRFFVYSMLFRIEVSWIRVIKQQKIWLKAYNTKKRRLPIAYLSRDVR